MLKKKKKNLKHIQAMSILKSKNNIEQIKGVYGKPRMQNMLKERQGVEEKKTCETIETITHDWSVQGGLHKDFNCAFICKICFNYPTPLILSILLWRQEELFLSPQIASSWANAQAIELSTISLKHLFDPSSM